MKEIEKEFEKWWNTLDESKSKSWRLKLMEKEFSKKGWITAAEKYSQPITVKFPSVDITDIDILKYMMGKRFGLTDELFSEFLDLRGELSKNIKQSKTTMEQLESIPENEMWRYELYDVSRSIVFCFGNPLNDSGKSYFVNSDNFYSSNGDPCISSLKLILSARPATKEERQKVYKKERRMMPLHDFSDAWVGMEVYHVNGSKGVIIGVYSYLDYAIKVEFEDFIDCFTRKGKSNVGDKAHSIATRPIKIVEV